MIFTQKEHVILRNLSHLISKCGKPLYPGLLHWIEQNRSENRKTYRIPNILENDTKQFFVNMQNFSNLQEVSKCVKKYSDSSIWTYYVASSASGQDEPNRAVWLATRAGDMEPSCPLGTTRCIPQEKFPESHISFIDQVCLVKMAGYWPRSCFASL